MWTVSVVINDNNSEKKAVGWKETKNHFKIRYIMWE